MPDVSAAGGPSRGHPGVFISTTSAAVEDVAGGVQSTFDFTVEVDGSAKPACIARPVHRHYA